jgi:hypothetical protein
MEFAAVIVHSGFAPNRPDEGGQTADQGGEGNHHGGIENKHTTTPASLVPYLFPRSNRKIPIKTAVE